MKIECLPGTTIEVDFSMKNPAKVILDPMFLSGGLVLSQVSSLTNLEPHIIQNWVKRGFLSPPINKKYSKRQFCRIVIINFLKDQLQIEKIVKLISYINAVLSDEADDIIDDSELYGYFVNIITMLDLGAASDMEKIRGIIDKEALHFHEPIVGSRQKLSNVLEVMVILYLTSRLKAVAELAIKNNFEGGFLW